MFIKVVDHNPNWRNEYQIEEQVIRRVLKGELVNSFHIGSTSISGLKAKPIIDILLVVQDIQKLDSYSNQFRDMGYEVMGYQEDDISAKEEIIEPTKFMLTSIIILKKLKDI